MSSDGWVKRGMFDEGLPADLKQADMVQYCLRGDDRAYGPSPAGKLFWGVPAPGDEGRIVAYRKVVTVPVASDPAVIESTRPHGHYYKPVAHLDHVDVYRVLDLFGVADPCLQHAIKKLLVAGGRGAGKDIRQDVKEAIDSLQRWQEMRAEDERRARVA